jgi:hypothetical protein
MVAVGCANRNELQADQAIAGPSIRTATHPPRPLGLVYAEAACGACHAVAAGDNLSPNAKAPPFEAIANTPGMTPMALNVWLHTPIHRDMPYVVVEPDRLDALVEYVYSLRS